VGLTACGGVEEGEAAERQAPNDRALRVEVARLDSATGARMESRLPGEVEGSQDVMLASALGGQVESVRVSKGDAVSKGQILARVDAEVYGAQLAQAEAQASQAQLEWNRIQELGDLASETQLLQTETQLKIADAQVRAARAQFNRAVIRAPFSGIAADVFTDPGEFVGPGSPVARIVQLDPVKVTLSVPDRDVVALRPDMDVMVTAAAVGQPVPGRISHVGRAADTRTRTFPVEVEVDNTEGNLLPGMIATVTLERSLPDGTLAIPQDWVVSRRSDEGMVQGVFVESDGYAKWSRVTLGDVLHDQVVITSGVTPGARVVVTGHRDLVDGDPVIVSREGVCCEHGRPVFGG
jgi:RND family efflux transporter MFP subunit